MQRIFSILPLLTLPAWALIDEDEPEQMQPPCETVIVANCAKISDSIGRAGMVAVPLISGGQTEIVMMGGANFPKARRTASGLTDLGPKVYYADIDVCSPSLGAVNRIGKLPYPIGYAAYAPTEHGVIIAGGCNAEGYLSKTIALRFTRNGVKVSELPDMPLPVAFPAFVSIGDKLYVFGGQDSADATAALKRCFVLENGAWKELAPMPDEGRMLAGAAVLNGKIYITGGCSLHPDAAGKGERTYLKSTLVYDPATDRWSSAADMPETMVGMSTPLPVYDNKMFVIGGDPGNYYRAKLQGTEPAEHPGQSRAVYRYEPDTDSWQPVGENTLGVATAPAVLIGNIAYTVSGEIRPAVRTPLISAVKLHAEGEQKPTEPQH